MAIVNAWSHKSSRDPAVSSLLRTLFLVAAQDNFNVSLRHLPGKNNALADALSRNQMNRFFTLAPHADPNQLRRPATASVCTHCSLANTDRNYPPPPHAGPATYPHSCCTDRHLTAQLQYLLSQAFAGATQSTYTAGVRRYLRFCEQYHLRPVPAHSHTVAFFAAALSRSLAPATVRVYLAAVANMHRALGVPSPTRRNQVLLYTWPSEGFDAQHTQGNVLDNHSPHQSCVRYYVELLHPGLCTGRTKEC